MVGILQISDANVGDTIGILRADKSIQLCQVVTTAAGGVVSVFGRVGAVVALDNDYTASQITGGMQQVADVAARNAIPLANRQVGQTVYEVDTDQLWRLIGGTANANWVDVTITQVTNARDGLAPAVGAVSTILQSTGIAAAWVAPLSWDSTFLSPTVTQTATAGATGQKLSIVAQAAATTGGALELGTGVGGTTPGEFRMFAGASQFGSFERSNANDFLAWGANPAATGRVRLPPGVGIVSREFAFGSDLNVYTSGTANNIQTFGDANASSVKINGPNGGGVGIQTGGTDRLTVSNTTFSIILATVAVGTVAAGSGFTFSILNTNSGANAGGFWRLRAMGTTSGNTNGAGVQLEGGRLNGTGLSGGVDLKLNQDDTQGNMWIMLQVVHVANTPRRAVSILRVAGVTTTQLPANSGDLVLYVGDAATVPSADAVSGHTYYSDGAKPAWRFNGINWRLDGTAATATLGIGVLPATPEGFLQTTINGTTAKIPYYNA